MKTIKEQSWKSFFKNKLEDSNFYERNDCGKSGDIYTEIYESKDQNDKTEIIVGYLDDKLIYLTFENPITIGFSEQQAIEYFYKYDFTPGESYGNPGLEFIEINIEAINNQLDFGLKGAEIQYYKNNKIFKSKIYIDEPNEYSTTINFQKKSFWKSILEKPKNEIITEKRIELSEIFSGLKNK